MDVEFSQLQFYRSIRVMDACIASNIMFVNNILEAFSSLKLMKVVDCVQFRHSAIVF